jgi:hypothetical protein
LPRALVIAVALHAFALAGARFKRTLGNETQEARNLAGAMACGAWIKANAPPDAIVQASLPRLVAFLCDRHTIAGKTEFAAIDYLLLTGQLRGVPAFSADDEALLRAGAEASGIAPVFASGDAAVYKLGPGE